MLATACISGTAWATSKLYSARCNCNNNPGHRRHRPAHSRATPAVSVPSISSLLHQPYPANLLQIRISRHRLRPKWDTTHHHRKAVTQINKPSLLLPSLHRRCSRNSEARSGTRFLDRLRHLLDLLASNLGTRTKFAGCWRARLSCVWLTSILNLRSLSRGPCHRLLPSRNVWLL